MISDTSKKTNLVWLDLETTGLDPNAGVILEVGIVITDLNLTEIARKNWVLPHIRESILPMMDDYVLDMHLGNGLLKEVWAQRRLDDLNDARWADRLEGVRQTTFKEIRGWIARKTTASHKHCFMAGSSVGGFDKLWLTKHAPTLLETMHYRVGDVSAFEVFFPGLLQEQVMAPAHRALDDLDYSMDKLRQMRKKLGLPAMAAEATE